MSEYTILAIPKIHHTQSLIHHARPHINGGESSLEGFVPDLRNRYFSFNLFYNQALALLSSKHSINTGTHTKHKHCKNRSNTDQVKISKTIALDLKKLTN